MDTLLKNTLNDVIENHWDNWLVTKKKKSQMVYSHRGLL